MQKDREFRGELWLLSVESHLFELRCLKCRKYLAGVSRFADIILREDGEAEFRRFGQALSVRLWLHASSPLFDEVFGVRGTATGPRLSGQCPTCGRAYTYAEQPRGGEPGTLSISLRPSASPQKISQPPSQPKASLSPEQPQPTMPDQPVRDQALSIARKSTAPRVPLPSKEAATTEGDRLEHSWTAAWEGGGSFWHLRPTPEAVWTEIRSGERSHDRPDVTALDRHTGEVLYQGATSELLGANQQIALLRPFGSTDVVYGRDARHGGHLWTLETFGSPVGLASNAVLSRGERGNLVAALFPTPGEAPVSWQALSEPGPWSLTSLLVNDELWTATYAGPGQRIEVRRSSDFQLLWSGEYASDERVYVSADAHGWLVRRGRQLECFDPNGQALWSTRGPEQICLSARFVVGRYSTGDAGIWGGTEAMLGGFRRPTGQPLSLPPQHFEGRYCYTLGDDILWCVCGRGPKLIGYHLVTRKMVTAPLELPAVILAAEPARRLQYLKAYGRDVYLTSRSGHLVRWSGERL